MIDDGCCVTWVVVDRTVCSFSRTIVLALPRRRCMTDHGRRVRPNGDPSGTPFRVAEPDCGTARIVLAAQCRKPRRLRRAQGRRRCRQARVGPLRQAQLDRCRYRPRPAREGTILLPSRSCECSRSLSFSLRNLLLSFFCTRRAPAISLCLVTRFLRHSTLLVSAPPLPPTTPFCSRGFREFFALCHFAAPTTTFLRFDTKHPRA